MPLHATESPDVFALVQKSCVGCHSAAVKSGDVDLAALRTAGHSKTIARSGKKSSRNSSSARCRPRDCRGRRPKPLPQSRAGWSLSLRGRIARSSRNAGRVAAHRLNRAEYNNTIRDLLGIDIRPADNFPADTAAHGFDNISDALESLPALLENYVDAAERAVRTALFGPERRSPPRCITPRPCASTIRAGVFPAQGSVSL